MVDNTIIKMSESTQLKRVNRLIVDPHTVFMTVGPSTCGKTTFCTNFLKPALSALPSADVRYLSSDAIRREILGGVGSTGVYNGDNNERDRYDLEMMNVSHLAFEQLFSRASSYMTWPCSAEFIILDTTGLNESFRKQVANLCREKHYNLVPILFDYKSYDEYYTYSMDKYIVTHHIETFRKKTLPNITRECECAKSSRIFYIKNQDFSQITIEVPKWTNYLKCFLPSGTKAIIVGNVFGCYDELILLLKQFKIELGEDGSAANTDIKIILIGSFDRSDSNIAANPTTIEKLQHLIEKSALANIICVNDKVPFVSIRHRWIVTSNFLEKKFLGKIDRISTQRRVNYSLVDHKNESIHNEPLRIFGSCPALKYERHDNLCAIDGGCVHGGSLIGIGFTSDNKPFVKRQQALKEYIPGQLRIIFPREIELITPDKLSPHTLYRYNKIIHSSAPFLSGTMAPAPADFKSGENTPEAFESLSQALQYYKNNNVNQVCLQPKYMGSRCTVVLNIQGPSYAISRGGYNIRIPGIAELLDSLKNRYLVDGTTTAIIDGELLPWIAMGQSLIDDTFRSVEVGLRKDLDLLNQYGFGEQLNRLAQVRSDTKLPLQKNNINKIGQGIYHSLVAYESFIPEWIGLEGMNNGLITYSNQLSLFSQDGPLEFKPFALLKTIDIHGEHIYEEGAGANFKRVSSDTCVIISVNDISALADAISYYQTITQDRRMEGIVVKPDLPMNNIGQIKCPGAPRALGSSVIPYMKVRNCNYLTLIYGPTYKESKRLAALIKRKRVGEKQKISRMQYDISQEMLRIPIIELSANNTKYCNLVATFLKTNEDEEKVDPRL